MFIVYAYVRLFFLFFCWCSGAGTLRWAHHICEFVDNIALKSEKYAIVIVILLLRIFHVHNDENAITCGVECNIMMHVRTIPGFFFFIV